MSASKRRSRSRASRLGLFVCLSLAACSATHLFDHETAHGGSSGDAGDSAQPSTGGSASALGGSNQSGSVATGGAALGGAGDVPGAAGVAPALGGAAGATSGGDGGAFDTPECVNDDDCHGADFCMYATCRAGQCVTLPRPKGSVIAPDTPPNCQATSCDGQGSKLAIIDLANHPTSTDPCLVDSCSAEGKLVEKPAPAGTPCSTLQAGQLCDGAGQCVQCLSAADCGGLACVLARCQVWTCGSLVQDGSETDIDCGGVCPPCAETKHCKIDQDCASDDCEPLRLTCLPTSCLDGKQDGSETDVDCGGADCSPCYFAKSCLVDADCATQKCDAQKHVCGGNTCRDNRIDGPETDIDCGGFYCAPCQTGQKCQSSFDCTTYCSLALPHVCL